MTAADDVCINGDNDRCNDGIDLVDNDDDADPLTVDGDTKGVDFNRGGVLGVVGEDDDE